MGAVIENIIGHKYNRLTVIEALPSKNFNGSSKRMWLCKCECGKEVITFTSSLKRNNTKSCGCLKDETNKDNSIKSRHKLANIDAGFSEIYNSYRNNAIQKGRDFELTIDDIKLIVAQNCFYCNDEPSNTIKRRYYKFNYNGIDRFDNNKGYTIENTVPCCKMCNIAKNNNSYDKFAEWVNRLTLNFKNSL
jgi:hypothetical protein